MTRIGIVGTERSASLMADAARCLGHDAIVLVPQRSAGSLEPARAGSIACLSALENHTRNMDLITFATDDVPAEWLDTLQSLDAAGAVNVFPRLETLSRLLRPGVQQTDWLSQNGLPSSGHPNPPGVAGSTTAPASQPATRPTAAGIWSVAVIRSRDGQLFNLPPVNVQALSTQQMQAGTSHSSLADAGTLKRAVGVARCAAARLGCHGLVGVEVMITCTGTIHILEMQTVNRWLSQSRATATDRSPYVLHLEAITRTVAAQ